MNVLQFIGLSRNFHPLVLLLFLTFSAFAQVPEGLSETTRTDFGGRNSITGSILSPSGSPINSRIRIRLSAPMGEVATTTDESGRFAISGLGNGTYTIHIDSDDNFEPERQDVEISVPRGSAAQVYSILIRLRAKPRKTAKAGVVDADTASIPKRALGLYRKSMELSAKGDNKGAVEQLLLAVAEYPEFMMAHTELGVQYQILNDLDKADEHLRAALKIKSDAYEPLANRGIVLVRLRRYDEAEPVLRGAIKIREASPIVHFYLGRSLLGQKRPDEAETEFRTAHSQGGNDMIEARRALATIYLERGENEKALAEIEAYLAANPTAADEKHLRDTVKQIKESLKANPKP